MSAATESRRSIPLQKSLFFTAYRLITCWELLMSGKIAKAGTFVPAFSIVWDMVLLQECSAGASYRREWVLHIKQAGAGAGYVETGGKGRYSSDGRASVLYSECRGFEACYRLQTAVPCCTVRTRTWHCRMSVLKNDASASGGCIRSRSQNMAGSFQEAGACTGAVFRTATVTVPRKPVRPGAFFKKGWWNEP